MKKIIYSKTIKDFLTDMGAGAYINLMESSAIENNLGATDSERTSWENNANALAKLIEKAGLQESDSYIGFEYSIPVGGRIDCIFFGKGDDGHANAVHVELAHLNLVAGKFLEESLLPVDDKPLDFIAPRLDALRGRHIIGRGLVVDERQVQDLARLLVQAYQEAPIVPQYVASR